MATTTTTLSEQEVRARIQRGRPLALGLGVLGLIVWASGLATNPKLALQGYHMAFFYWMGLSLGCLGFALLLHTVRGRWGLPLIRIFESGALLIAPLMAVAFLPILYDVFVAHSIFEWTHKEVVAADPVLQAKRPWLNETRFAIGALIYFAVFAFFAYRLWNGSKQEDEAGDPIKAEFLSRQRSGHAAFGIVVFMLLFTLAMVDWGQSLMPHWFSTMYAVIMIAGFGLNALALALYMVLSWRDLPLYKPIVYHEGYEGYRRDWGNFMFTLCVFWSYVSFSQLLITYSGNLYEFTQFYLRRNTGGWQYIAYIIPIFHFFVPFFWFLAPRTKWLPKQLLVGVMIVLAIRVVEIFWQIKPMWSETLSISVYDVAAFVGLGGVWMYMMLGNLLKRPLVPKNEPRLLETAH
jgi:hypothetical protein